MPQTALRVEKAQSPFVLRSVPIPKPGPGQVLIKIKACALNPVDWGVQAIDIIPNMSYPAILGMDIAGDVEEVGESVQEFTKGERVFVLGEYPKEYAGFQQYALGPVSLLGKIPPHLSYAEASSIPLAFATAAIPLLASNPIGLGMNPTFDPKIKFAGEPALVIGGATSVGQYAIQILKFLGFSSIITYASAKHSEYLKSLGATHIIDRTDVPLSSLPETVKTVTTSTPIKTVYVAFIMDPKVIDAGYQCLAHGGRMAVAHPVPPKFDDADATERIICGVTVHKESNMEFIREIWKHLPALVHDGVIKPNRIEEIPFGLVGVAGSLPRFATGGVSGVKLVINPQENP